MVRHSSDCRFSSKYGNNFYTCDCTNKFDKPFLCLKPDLCDDFKIK